MRISISTAFQIKRIDFCVQILAIPVMLLVVLNLNGNNRIDPAFFFSECTIQILSYIFWFLFKPEVHVTRQRRKLNIYFTIVIAVGIACCMVPTFIMLFLMLLLPVGAVLGTIYLINTNEEIEILKGAIRPLSAIR